MAWAGNEIFHPTRRCVRSASTARSRAPSSARRTRATRPKPGRGDGGRAVRSKVGWGELGRWVRHGRMRGARGRRSRARRPRPRRGPGAAGGPSGAAPKATRRRGRGANVGAPPGAGADDVLAEALDVEAEPRVLACGAPLRAGGVRGGGGARARDGSAARRGAPRAAAASRRRLVGRRRPAPAPAPAGRGSCRCRSGGTWAARGRERRALGGARSGRVPLDAAHPRTSDHPRSVLEMETPPSRRSRPTQVEARSMHPRAAPGGTTSSPARRPRAPAAPRPDIAARELGRVGADDARERSSPAASSDARRRRLGRRGAARGVPRGRARARGSGARRRRLRGGRRVDARGAVARPTGARAAGRGRARRPAAGGASGPGRRGPPRSGAPAGPSRMPIVWLLPVPVCP